MTNQKGFLREIEDQALIFSHDYALTAYVFFILSHTALAYLIYLNFPSPWVIFWLASFYLVETISVICRLKIRNSLLQHKTKLSLTTFLNIIDGIAVSSCVAFFPVIDISAQTIIISVLLVECTGAITTTIGYRRFYYAFTTPIYCLVAFSFLPIIFVNVGLSGLAVAFTSGLMIVGVLKQLSERIFLNFGEAFSSNLKFAHANEELEIAVKDAKLANESKTRFLASASHDLRQPINTLSLFVANLSLKDRSGDYTEIIGHMNSAIGSIDAQLESLLDISKLDAGVVETKISDVNLVTLIDDLVAANQNIENIKFSFISELESLAVRTDVVLFERILSNLISNAIKYTPKGFVDVRLEHDDMHAFISVKDTGIGIQKAELTHIFDEFYQVGNSERDAAKGLGLGLSIVKRLADLLDIQISIDSEYGVGTEVTMKFNYESIEFDEDFAQYVNPLENNSPKEIIVLDNETSILFATQSVFEAMDHSVETFSDSNQALSCFENRAFDIALVDYRLSDGIFGDAVIERMSKINTSTKFYLVTGDNNIKENGHFEVIHKPLTEQKLEYILTN